MNLKLKRCIRVLTKLVLQPLQLVKQGAQGKAACFDDRKFVQGRQERKARDWASIAGDRRWCSRAKRALPHQTTKNQREWMCFP